MAIDYTFDSTKESQAQYLARTQPSNGSPKGGADSFVTALQSKLMGQSDLISSSNTGIEDKIAQAIGGIQSATKSSSAAIESAGNRQIAEAQGQQANAITGQLESRSGFATNIVALRTLVDSTDKNIKDLEQRKQELILQNDAAGASKVSDLQLQGLKFKQDAMQTTFSNLLGMANFGLSAQQQETQKAQFEKSYSFQENQAMSQVALQYGLSLNPGESLQSLYSRATKDMGANSPAALAIKQAQASINASNASAAKAYSDLNANKPLDAATLAALGEEYTRNPQAVLGAVKTTDQLGQILGSAAVVQSKNIEIAVNQDKTAGVTKASAIDKITNNANLSASQQVEALKKIEAAYGPDSAQPVSDVTLPGLSAAWTAGQMSAQQAITHFLTGQ